jgi:AcrR family transcriptional regulator
MKPDSHAGTRSSRARAPAPARARRSKNDTRAQPRAGRVGERRGDEARRALLAAALDEFAHRGPEDATTREIARKSGQNIAAIAYHFGSKQGLYVAVAEAIVARMLTLLEPALNRMEAIARDPAASPAICLDGLKTLVRGLCHAMTMEETRAISRIVIREQLDPTSAFDVIYQYGIGRMHKALTALAARYVGDDAQSTGAVIRAHTLLGSVIGFRVAQETILRRAGWKTIGPAESAAIADTLAEHVEILLRGLRTARRRRTPSTSRGHR